ncbi:hypothetical protein [uncultured Cedecea sp.]|uniref:hypothetical protein n=1 Tax=uncultured Cedecea sp. TaxID=988762 RepID=UPI00262380B8|nr:hypothetical protein [uncultured Cedecea sp.]
MSKASFSIGEQTVQFSEPAISLPTGYLSIAQTFFHRDIPSSYEVEMAIATFEDHLQATPQLHHIAPEFTCHDDYLKQIMKITGVENEISQTEIERVFNRVADVVSGSPKRDGEFPEDKNFISYLLIIRELSHHLNIETISSR